MVYDEQLARRVRDALDARRSTITERRMFGGIAFMDRGNMCLGVIRDDLMARVGAADHADALGQPGARVMDFVGKPMTGMVYVAADAVATQDSLDAWVQRCLAFTDSLPAK